MPVHTITDPRDSNDDGAGPVLGGLTCYVTRRTPVKVSGPAGIRSGELRVGYRQEILLRADPSDGADTRLTQLVHLEGFLVHAVVAVRLALREEADHIAGQAVEARKVDVSDDESVTAVGAP